MTGPTATPWNHPARTWRPSSPELRSELDLDNLHSPAGAWSYGQRRSRSDPYKSIPGPGVASVPLEPKFQRNLGGPNLSRPFVNRRELVNAFWLALGRHDLSRPKVLDHFGQG